MRKPRDLSPMPAPENFDLAKRMPMNGDDIDRIRRRAYELYETRTRSNSPGDPVSDRLQAEKQLEDQAAKEHGARLG